MTLAVRQTVGKELLEELELLYLRDSAPDPFTARALGKKADALQKVDAAEASVAKAALAALDWDMATANYWVDNAIMLDFSVYTLTNAAVALRYVNAMHREVEILAQAYQLAPADQSVVIAYLDALLYCGRIEAASTVYSTAMKQSIDLSSHVRDASLFHDSVAAVGIASERLEFEVGAVIQVLTANRRRARELHALVDVDQDGGRCLVLTYGFLGDLDDELRLEAQLANLLGDSPEWNPMKLSIELRSLPVDAHIAV